MPHAIKGPQKRLGYSGCSGLLYNRSGIWKPRSPRQIFLHFAPAASFIAARTRGPEYFGPVWFGLGVLTVDVSVSQYWGCATSRQVSVSFIYTLGWRDNLLSYSVWVVWKVPSIPNKTYSLRFVSSRLNIVSALSPARTPRHALLVTIEEYTFPHFSTSNMLWKPTIELTHTRYPFSVHVYNDFWFGDGALSSPGAVMHRSWAPATPEKSLRCWGFPTYAGQDTPGGCPFLSPGCCSCRHKEISMIRG